MYRVSRSGTRSQILSLDWADIVDSCIVLCYRQATEAGGQPYARVDYIPQSGTKNLATEQR